MVVWPKPKTIIELKGFLGLMDYYRKFVKNFTCIARPLTNMFKKYNFSWNKEIEMAFETLKKVMTTTLVLTMPNFEKVLKLHMDASNVGINAVLTRREAICLH